MTDALSTSLNPTSYSSGPMPVTIVMYDNNNNRSELDLSITLSNSGGAAPSATPVFQLYAITYGESRAFFRTAQDNSTVLVDIWVNKVAGTTGIRVYRSDSSDGPYAPAGMTTRYNSTYNQYNFTDTSSLLTPGETFYYKLALMNQYGEGPQTAVITSPVLPKYNLALVSPANYSVISTPTPTFQWTAGDITGFTRYDQISVSYALTGSTVWTSAWLNGQSEASYPASLAYDALYQWNISSMYQYTCTMGSSTVYGLSYPGSGSASNNGAFYFSVHQ
jgi:hypothetical protein